MYKVMAIGTQHHKVGILVGMLGGDCLRQFPQRQVGGDDTDELALSVVQRHTVRGYHLRTGQCTCVVVIKWVHPAGGILLAWCLVPYLVIIVIVSLTHRSH